MDTYKVDIRFPSLNTSDPVVISGLAENVDEARDQLLLLEEEYVSVKLVVRGSEVFGWEMPFVSIKTSHF